MAEPEYRRLTKTRVRRKGAFAITATRTSLWLGNDHLLSIDSTGYTEEYKRFYFRDIQALTICGNQRRVVWNWILLAVLVIPLAWLATMLFDREINSNAIWILWSIITSILLIPLIVNNLFGATCNCYLRTAVQVEELASLSRIRRAQKALARLRPLIAGAQGDLSAEEIPARLRALAQDVKPVVAPQSKPEIFVIDDPNSPPQSPH
jgi:hypothetical protein